MALKKRKETAKKSVTSNRPSSKDDLSGIVRVGIDSELDEKGEFFGHVYTVAVYNSEDYAGCHALIRLRDHQQVAVAVQTDDESFLSILQSAVISDNLVAFTGKRLINPKTPKGGVWQMPVYEPNSIILYTSGSGNE